MQKVSDLLNGHQYLWLYAWALGLSFFFSWLLTPMVRRVAIKWGVTDRPDRRKVHQRLISRWGGLALSLGFFLSLGFLILFSDKFRRLLSFQGFWLTKEFIGVCLGSLLILLLGLFDDRQPVPPKVKLIIQILAVFFLVVFGIKINAFTNPFTGHIVELGVLGSLSLTLLWVITLLNAFNFIDGLDGLAAGVACIAGINFFIVSLILKQGASPVNLGHLTFTAILSCALIGATLGFLRYNFYPATIFMGDGGSLFLGYVLSAIALMGTFKTTATLSVILPLFAVGVPVLDAFWVLLNRFLKREPLSKPDKSHMHHRLLSKGFSHPQAVVRVYILSGVLGAIAIVLAWVK